MREVPAAASKSVVVTAATTAQPVGVIKRMVAAQSNYQLMNNSVQTLQQPRQLERDLLVVVTAAPAC